MTTNPHDQHLADFARILGLERNLLEYLLYKLVAARLLMAGTDPRYMIQSLAEVEDALDRVRDIAGGRETALAEIARAVGLDRHQFTIARLAELAPPATRFMMYELKHEYVRLAYQIEQVSSGNKRLAGLALDITAEVLENLADEHRVQINVTGDDVVGFSRGNDVLSVLDAAAAVGDGDSAGLDAGISALDGSIDAVLDGLTRLGTAANQGEAAHIDQLRGIGALGVMVSHIEDIDLAESIMEMQLQEVAYQAALSASSRALQPSLVDFLA